MEEQTTLNAGGDTTSPAGSSPASGNFDAFIPTMPEDAPAQPPAEAQTTEEQSAQEVPAQEAGQEAAGEEPPVEPGETDDKPEPFHKHPRFQEITKQNREMKQALSEMRQQMESLAKGQAGDAPGEPDFDQQFAEISQKLEDGDLSLSQAMEQQRKLIEASSQRQLQSVMDQQKRDVETTRMKESFLSKYPDYAEVTESDDLAAIIESDPIHDEVSAYGIYKWQQEIASKETAIKEAVDKAVKETESRIRKEYAAKRNAASLGDSASHVPRSGPAPELQDTSKFGGKVSVMANRLKAMREAR